MKTLPIGRIIAYVVAGALAVAGAFSLSEANRIREELDRQSRARPFDLIVDLSRPGAFAGEFLQTWEVSHGQGISLHVPANVLAEVPSSNLLASLEFKWRITDSDGEVVREGEVCFDETSSTAPLSQGIIHGGAIQLAYFHPFDRGTYRFNCTVVTGAPGLAGIDQRLVCHYLPCGFEMLPVIFGTITGIAALVIAGVILLVTRAVTIRRKKKARQQPDLCG